jgi:ring-1,2-phenylacetyl-CoA epoxidase subunit PaaB
MNDTQWPRFQVFLQDKEGAPHQDVGSVHAPDPELALLNARDVFVRRPECINLWVVPVSAILTKTFQELQATDRESEAGRRGSGYSSEEEYQVFCKIRPAGTHTLVGQVLAVSPSMAMAVAVKRFSGKTVPFSWLVFPSSKVTHSDPQDLESMFTPARDKLFRMSTNFHTFSAMRKIMADSDSDESKEASG